MKRYEIAVEGIADTEIPRIAPMDREAAAYALDALNEAGEDPDNYVWV